MKIESKNTFLESIVNFDFDKHYTKQRRIATHILMWMIYTFIIQIGYHWGYKLNYFTSIFMAIRLTLCNVAVFYLLFYIVIPNTIVKNRVILFFISVFLLFEIWLLINNSIYILAYKYSSNYDFGIIKETLKNTSKKNVIDVINPINVIGHSFDIIGAISPILFLKFAFSLSKTYSNEIKANRKIEKLNYDNLLIENKFLQSQLNPHFLFNTLNNLYALAIKKSDITSELILKLSDIMRYTLYDANVKKISINKEIDFIENYFEMERMRYPKDYLIDKKINLLKENIEIEPLLFFVFIENAFKYGLKSENPFLRMILKTTEKDIYFSIENDDSKISNNTKYKGLGIENAKRRLDLLYPEKHVLSIHKKENIFKVELQIYLN